MKTEYKVLKEKVMEYKEDVQFYGNIFAKMNRLEQAKAGKPEAAPMVIDSKAYCYSYSYTYINILKLSSNGYLILAEKQFGQTSKLDRPVPDSIRFVIVEPVQSTLFPKHGFS